MAKYLGPAPDRRGPKYLGPLTDDDMQTIKPDPGKANNSIQYGEMLRLPPDEVYERHDMIKGVADKEQGPGTFERWSMGWEHGKITHRLAQLGRDAFRSGNYERNALHERTYLKTRQAELESKLGKDAPYLVKAVEEVAKMGPLMIGNVEQGLKTGMGVTAAVAGVGAITGVGAAAALPAFPVAVTAGSIMAAGEMEAGLMYDDMYDIVDENGKQLDPMARNVATLAVGAINGAIEMGQIGLLIKTIPGGDKLISKLTRSAVKKAVASEGFKGIALKLGKKYAATVAGETGQEVLQESTNIFMEHLAKEIGMATENGEIEQKTGQEILNQLGQTFVSSGMAFSVLPFPGLGVQAAIETKQLVGDNMKKQAKPAPDSRGLMQLKLQMKQAAPELTDEQTNALGTLVDGVAKYRGVTTDEYVADRFAGVVAGGPPSPSSLFKDELKAKKTGATYKANFPFMESYINDMFADEDHEVYINEMHEYMRGINRLKGEGAIRLNSKTILSIDLNTTCPFIEGGMEACAYCYVEMPRSRQELGQKLPMPPPKRHDALKYDSSMILDMPDHMVQFFNEKLGGMRVFAFSGWKPQQDDMMRQIVADAQEKGLQLKVICRQPEFNAKYGNEPNINLNVSTDFWFPETIARGNPQLQAVFEDARMLIARGPGKEESIKIRDESRKAVIRYTALNREEGIAAIADPDIAVVTMYHGIRDPAKLVGIWKHQNPSYFENLGPETVQAFAEAFSSEKSATPAGIQKVTQKELDKILGPGKMTPEKFKELALEKLCCQSKKCGTCTICCGFKSGEGDSILSKFLAGKPRASVEFDQDNRAVIRALKHTNVADMAHELGHVFRRDLRGPELQAVQEWAGVQGGRWTVEQEERFANAFEKYLREGEAPNKRMRVVFEQFKTWLHNIYESIKGTPLDEEITPELRWAFDRLVGQGMPTKKDAQGRPSFSLQAFAPVAEEDYVASMVKMPEKGKPFVTQYTADQLRDEKYSTYLSEDGMTGYYIGEDGYWGGLFSYSPELDVGKEAIFQAIENGATHGDAFEGYLPRLYHKFGSKVHNVLQWNDEYAPPGWNYKEFGKPNVVEFTFEGGNPDTLRFRYDSFGAYTPRELAEGQGAGELPGVGDEGLGAGEGRAVGAGTQDFPVSPALAHLVTVEVPERAKRITDIEREVVRLQRENKRLKLIDPMTGLLSKEGEQAATLALMKRAKKQGKDVTFFRLDLHGFKAFNDIQGHERGDDALRVVADALRHVATGKAIPEIRALVSRRTGDEFGIVSNLPKETAKHVSRAVEDYINYSLSEAGFDGLTIEAGSASNLDTAEALHQEAERNLELRKADTYSALGEERRGHGQDVLHKTDPVQATEDLEVMEYLRNAGYSDAPILPIESEMLDAYDSFKDTLLGRRDVRILQAQALKRKLQHRIKAFVGESGLFGRGIQFGDEAKDLDRAIQIYIDSKQNPEHLKEYYYELPAEKQAIIDLSQNLPDEILEVADEIAAAYDKIASEALDDDVIHNVLDNYVARRWNLKDKEQMQESLRKFGTTTGHAKKRRLDTIIEGWALGLELEIEGATNNLELYQTELVRTLEYKKFLKAMSKCKTVDGHGMLVAGGEKVPDGYKKIEHPNFTVWQFAGKGDPAEDIRAKNMFMAEDGTLMERREVYAPEPVADDLNKIFGSSKLYTVKGVKTLTKYNALAKSWILQSSFFHHLAFMRSYYLGTNHKKFSEMNFVSAYKEGLRAIESLHDDVVLGVQHGLTLGLRQDWEENLIREKTAIGAVIDRIPGGEAVKDVVLSLRDRQAEYLFGELGSGLKAKAFLIEYRQHIRKGKAPDEAARLAATLINDDFGGLHLERLGRNPTLQHVFRLFALAPDWTESNIRTMVGTLVKISGSKDPKAEKAMYRKFWIRAMMKGMSATVLANFILAGGDIDELLKNYERAWEEGNLKWMGVDVTPIYKALGGETDRRKYFHIIGHFKDPFKALIHPLKFAHHKGSVVYTTMFEAIAGEDWAGRRFTDFTELIGEGVTVKGGKGRTVNYSQLPSYIISQIIGMQPVQVQNLVAMLSGEMEVFDGITNSMGLGVTSTYEKEISR